MQNALLMDLCPRFQTGKENSLCQTHTYHLLTSLILSYHRKIEFSRLELIIKEEPQHGYKSNVYGEETKVTLYFSFLISHLQECNQ